MKTMKPRIVAYKPLPDDVLAYLREHADVVQADGPAALADALGDAHGAIGASLKVTPQMLDRAPKLKAWSTISVGYDNFDVADLTRRGIVLAHTPDVLTESTADTVFSLILASARRVVELAEWVKAGRWHRSIGPDLYGTDVQGKTLGIVGLGRIGGAVARRAALGFRMQVLYANRSAHAEAETQYGARRVTLDELLAQSDFVCLQVPLSPDTRHLIGAPEFAKMKRGAILINASRGPVVDEAALVDALRAGRLGGAGLDTFAVEPLPPGHALLSLDNVILTPHVAGVTRNAARQVALMTAKNVVDAVAGRALPRGHVVAAPAA